MPRGYHDVAQPLWSGMNYSGQNVFQLSWGYHFLNAELLAKLPVVILDDIACLA